MKRNMGPRKVDSILKDMMRANPVFQIGRQRSLRLALSEIMERQVGGCAGKCRLISLARGVVTIGVESAVIRHELQCFFSQQVLGELQQAMPQINAHKVKFVLAAAPDGVDIGKKK